MAEQGVTGYTSTLNDNGYSLRMYYDQKYDIEKNESTVTMHLEGWHGSYAPAYADGTVTAGGAVVKTWSSYAGDGGLQPNNSWSRVGSGDFTKVVQHNQDGTGSITVSLSGNRYGDFMFINPAYSYTHASFSGSWTITLTTIPRASDVSANDIMIGSACDVSWRPNSSAFGYKLKFSLGQWSEWSRNISPNTTSLYKYSAYTVPFASANQIPNSTSGTMTVTLYTYTDATCTTQLGTEKSTTFMATLPVNVVPSVSNLQVAIGNVNDIVNQWGIALASFSTVRLKANGTGIYGSTISSFTISGGYNRTVVGSSLDYTGGTITSSGNKTFSVTCTDSRGRTSAAVVSSPVNFIAYSNPEVQVFSADRSKTDNSVIIVRAQWSFASVNGKNIALGALQYKQSDQSAWTTYGTIQNGTTTLTTKFDTLHSYNFRLVVTDTLGNKAQGGYNVSTMEVLLDFKAGGKGIGVGKICESDAIEVAIPLKTMSDIYVGSETLEEYIIRIVGGSPGGTYPGLNSIVDAVIEKLGTYTGEILENYNGEVV